MMRRRGGSASKTPLNQHHPPLPRKCAQSDFFSGPFHPPADFKHEICGMYYLIFLLFITRLPFWVTWYLISPLSTFSFWLLPWTSNGQSVVRCSPRGCFRCCFFLTVDFSFSPSCFAPIFLSPCLFFLLIVFVLQSWNRVWAKSIGLMIFPAWWFGQFCFPPLYTHSIFFSMARKNIGWVNMACFDRKKVISPVFFDCLGEVVLASLVCLGYQRVAGAHTLAANFSWGGGG